MKFGQWTAKRPWDGAMVQENTATDDLNTPEFIRTENSLTICSRKNYTVGRWDSYLESVNVNSAYEISVRFSTAGKAVRVFAVVIGVGSDGGGLTMDYLHEVENGLLSYVYQPIPGVCKLRLELTSSCYGDGSASFELPEVSTSLKKTGSIRVGTTYFPIPEEGFSFIGESLPIIERIIDNAAKAPDKPDILLFTETASDRGVHNLTLMEKGIREDCEIMRRIRAKAKECQMHLIFSIHEKTESGFYNTAYVIDDAGEIAGKYRKVQITYSELSGGMMPGEKINVIETRFGKIGILICWDQWYPEVAREMYRQGAKIFFSPTAGMPICIQQARARENGVPFVAAYSADPRYCSIYNSRGEEVAFITDVEKGYVTAEVSLDEEEYTYWLGVGPDVSALGGCARNVHLAEIRKDIY